MAKITNYWRLAVLISTLLLFFSIPYIHGSLNSADGYGIVSQRQAPDFSLYNHHQQTVSLKDFRGRYVFLMFGFINCEDICHSQALLFQEIHALVDYKDKPVFLYLAMDPERDTADKLFQYFDSRGDGFYSLSARTESQMKKIAADYRAFYTFVAKDNPDQYDINHNGFYFLIDDLGAIRYVYTAKHRDSRLIHKDLQTLIANK